MISIDDIRNLATLARLKLSAQEEASLQKDISSILEYVGQVSEVKVKEGAGSKPLLRNAMRDDKLRAEGDELAGKEESLRAAFPKREGNFNVVRKIIQKDE